MLLSKGNYYLREISSLLKISPSEAHAAVKNLLKLRFVRENREKNIIVIRKIIVKNNWVFNSDSSEEYDNYE